MPVDRPRARTTDGREVILDPSAAFAADDLLGQVVLERMLQGLTTRRHRAAGEPVGVAVQAEARATSKSAVSRRFIAQTAKALQELLGRDLSDLEVAVLMVDGICVAEHCCVVALAILADGTTLPVGRWLGDPENTTVVTHLLADLQDPGPGRLAWAAGGAGWSQGAAPGRAQGVRRGRAAPTLHHPQAPQRHRPSTKDRAGWGDAKLARAFAHPDPEAGRRGARELARTLQARHPGAAASLREGLEEMFTARRLGVSDRLARTLTSTNPVESMIWIARTTARNVKRWKDGEMVCC